MKKEKDIERELLQIDCLDCANYDGFGQCIEHGNNLNENCVDYIKEG